MYFFKSLEEYINTVYYEACDKRKASFLVFFVSDALQSYRFYYAHKRSENAVAKELESWLRYPHVAFFKGKIVSYCKLEKFLSKEHTYEYAYPPTWEEVSDKKFR